MKHLSLDIETYAGVDLGKSGVYAYTSDPTFRILLLAYAYDDEAVTVLDLEQGETIPETLAADLYDPSVYKHAYNAQFERICLGRSLQRYIAPEGWHCTMVHASSLSLPRSLAGVAKVLGLEEQKMDEGKRLIRSFSMPQKTRDGKAAVRKRPKDAPEEWALFKDYCRQDVVVERAIRKRLESFPLTAKEQRYFELDQRINDRGVRVDTELLAHALEADRRSKEAANDQASALTGLENPNSVAQLKEWFDAQGYPVDALDKATVSELLEDADGEAREMLTLRQEMAKTSVGKYLAIARHLCPDKRVRGMFKFYGANRTGRFSGSGVQLQNLPRNTIKDLDAARALLKEGRYEELGLLYGSVSQLLSELVRTAFIAEPGMVFLDADYASIEARVLAWLAGEQWVLDVFHGDGKIYEATAARMFGVPMASITKGSELRQKGKVAALACIAKGELVLTDKGLVPIEAITLEHRLWDGMDWVAHEGLIDQGKREIIEYDGLKATGDHSVFVEGEELPIPFALAKECRKTLRKCGVGRQAIRLGEDYQARETLDEHLERKLCSLPVYGLPNDQMDQLRQSEKGDKQRLPTLFTTTKSPSMARSKADCRQATLRESGRPGLCQIWSERDRFPLRECAGGRAVSASALSKSELQTSTGSDRQQRTLRTRQSSAGGGVEKQGESSDYSSVRMGSDLLAVCAKCCDAKAQCGTNAGCGHTGCQDSCRTKTQELACDRCKTHVYDIRNAGPNHRFTVSGKLVHNCGYGGGTGALKAMGAVKMGLSEEELPGLIRGWRKANPKIVQFWHDIEKAALHVVREQTAQVVGRVRLHCRSGILFIDLPSGRSLHYIKPQLGENRFGNESVTYEGLGMSKWIRMEGYGGKFVENITQAIARDILVHGMEQLEAAGFPIVMHIHDEVVIETKREELETVCRIVSTPPDWAKDLPLAAEGFIARYFKKD